MKRVSVFCGASPGHNPVYALQARKLGEALVQRKLELVYGGANVGLMGTLANAVLAQNGKVIGVIPRHLLRQEVAHQKLEDLRIVESMHQRKALMAELSDAFIALPGGFGTFEEFFEILTWAQLSLHAKPIALLNVDGYYDPLIQMMDRALQEGFLTKETRNLVH